MKEITKLLTELQTEFDRKRQAFQHVWNQGGPDCEKYDLAFSWFCIGYDLRKHDEELRNLVPTEVKGVRDETNLNT